MEHFKSFIAERNERRNMDFIFEFMLNYYEIDEIRTLVSKELQEELEGLLTIYVDVSSDEYNAWGMKSVGVPVRQTLRDSINDGYYIIDANAMRLAPLLQNILNQKYFTKTFRESLDKLEDLEKDKKSD
jgi:hypothetical protein